LREHALHARTVQLKLRYHDFTTITRAHTLAQSTQVDVEVLSAIKTLFRRNWKRGVAVRLLGVQVSSLESVAGQMPLLDGAQHEKWQHALSAADKLRDRFGERAVGLGSAM